MNLTQKPQVQSQMGDTTNQYTSGIKNNSKQNYHGQSSTTTYGCETELQKKRRVDVQSIKVGV